MSRPFVVLSAVVQTTRSSQEDTHTILYPLPASGSSSETDSTAIFAIVCDGHGGAQVSEYVTAKFYAKFIETSGYSQSDYEEAFRKGFAAIENDLQSQKEFQV